jgi:short-subunit dehydrogenase
MTGWQRRLALDLRGSRVVVTGASAGLGRAIARELARRYRARLVLVARRAHLLDALARELSAEFGVLAEPLVIDLADEGAPERVFEVARRGGAVDALVANAAHYWFGEMAEMPPALLERMLRVNALAPVTLLRRFLPYFDARRAGGALVITSTGALMPTPRQAVYGGTKALLHSVVESVQFERGARQQQRVPLCLFAPGGIATEMLLSSDAHAHVQRNAIVRRMVMRPEQVATQAVRALSEGRPLTIPGALNRAMVRMARWLPKQQVGEAAARFYGYEPT